tara:strand:- start:45 stop:488 length:444 start_codon:yes stop_codon:yes gene_type:complete
MVMTKEERKEYDRIYRENNKEKLREYHRIWRENNIDKVRESERVKIYRENNKEKVAEKDEKYGKTPAGKKARIMARWRHRGVINVNDEMYNNYIATTHCECCSKEFSSSRDRQLDHDHETGEFRWVLCHACNNNDNWKKKINTHLAV